MGFVWNPIEAGKTTTSVRLRICQRIVPGYLF
jgi:hypothetical protein